VYYIECMPPTGTVQHSNTVIWSSYRIQIFLEISILLTSHAVAWSQDPDIIGIIQKIIS